MGAGQIRIAGDVPHPGKGRRFEGWDRYESAVNTVWQDFPVWSWCLYDTATAPQAVLDIVERTHPRIVSPAGHHRASDRYQDTLGFEGIPYAPDPLEDSAPTIELVNRPAADARHALAQIGPGRIPATALDDLLIAVSEAISNAQRHGRPPATVRIWAPPGRIVVTVHDTGHGPADRLAGLIPAPGNTSDQRLGLGLWAMHQLDIDVTLRQGGPTTASPSGSAAEQYLAEPRRRQPERITDPNAAHTRPAHSSPAPESALRAAPGPESNHSL
jgi:anti-sigma regulatory factor (Ser/Thr protein kinase)